MISDSGRRGYPQTFCRLNLLTCAENRPLVDEVLAAQERIAVESHGHDSRGAVSHLPGYGPVG